MGGLSSPLSRWIILLEIGGLFISCCVSVEPVSIIIWARLRDSGGETARREKQKRLGEGPYKDVVPGGWKEKGSSLGRRQTILSSKGRCTTTLCPSGRCLCYKPFPCLTLSSTERKRNRSFPLKITKALLPFRGTQHGLAWQFPECVPLGANRC